MFVLLYKKRFFSFSLIFDFISALHEKGIRLLSLFLTPYKYFCINALFWYNLNYGNQCRKAYWLIMCNLLFYDIILNPLSYFKYHIVSLVCSRNTFSGCLLYVPYCNLTEFDISFSVTIFSTVNMHAVLHSVLFSYQKNCSHSKLHSGWELRRATLYRI